MLEVRSSRRETPRVLIMRGRLHGGLSAGCRRALSPLICWSVEFRILGPLVVLDDRGVEVSLKGARLRSLLALLVLQVGRVVGVDRICEELWGYLQPADANAALQNQISRLRSSLKDAGLAEVIETRPPGYVLSVDPATVDAYRFESAAREGRALLDQGQALRALELLSSAIDLWRGEPLIDLGYGDLARAEQ